MLMTLEIDILMGVVTNDGSVKIDDGEYPLNPDLGPAEVMMDDGVPCFVRKAENTSVPPGEYVVYVFGKRSGELLCWTTLERLEGEKEKSAPIVRPHRRHFRPVHRQHYFSGRPRYDRAA